MSYSIKRKKNSSKLIKKFDIGSPCFTSPIVEDDKITTVTMDGEVLTYSL